MANDLNQCNFIGRLGKDPEVRYMPNGDPVANFSIAVSESWKDQSGQKQERTEWVNLTAYKGLAKVIGEYVKKSDTIFVSGKMKTRKWQDQSGNDRYTTEVIVSDMQMLGGKSGQQSNQQPQQQPRQQRQQTQPAQSQEPNFDFDDELPPF